MSTREGASIHGWSTGTDGAVLYLLRPIGATLPEPVHELMVTERDRLPLLSAGTITAGSIRLTTEGAFDGDQKVAERLSISRDDILEVRLFVSTRHKKAFTVLGLAGGLVAGMVLYSVGASNHWDVSYDTLGTLIPVCGAAGAVAGYVLGRGGEKDIIYSTPATSTPGIDDATWKRIREQLPLSLRSPR